MRHLAPAAFVALLALGLSGCPVEDSETIPTGIELVPSEILDFGTIYECEEATDQIQIINHGPDTVTATIDVSAIVAQGYAVTGFVPETTLLAGDDHSIAIKVAPGPGGAGVREGYVFITADIAHNVLVTTEVVAGDLCD